jgi:hypothetical protein
MLKNMKNMKTKRKKTVVFFVILSMQFSVLTACKRHTLTQQMISAEGHLESPEEAFAPVYLQVPVIALVIAMTSSAWYYEQNYMW